MSSANEPAAVAIACWVSTISASCADSPLMPTRPGPFGPPSPGPARDLSRVLRQPGPALADELHELRDPARGGRDRLLGLDDQRQLRRLATHADAPRAIRTSIGRTGAGP